MTRRPLVLVAESRGFSEAGQAALESVACVRLADLRREELLRDVADADVLWVRLRNRIDAPVLDSAPRLLLIASPTTGLAHIDLDEARRRGVTVMSLQGEHKLLERTPATAELTIALVLSLLRRIPAAAAAAAAGDWDRDTWKGNELAGKTLGVIGFGRVGRQVASIAQAMNANVVACDPTFRSQEESTGVRALALDDLLSSSDVVTLHASHSEGDAPLLREREIACMREGALLVNTARGELVDEAALLDALRAGALGGAALDVLAREQAIDPATHSVLRYAREHDNLIVTPHLGGATVESMERTEIHLARRVAAWISSAFAQV